MTLLELIKSRTSVRKFSSRDVPEDMVRAILEAARWAPTAGNLQPWFFYVVRDRALREALASFALNQGFVARAPVCFVVCAEPHRSAGVYGSRGRDLYCIQDTAAAVQNILLAATALGLGSCWVGAFDEEKVRDFLKMPEGRRPVAIVPVGYAEPGGGGRPGRRETKEIARFL
ncbi:MAG: nitroreductase family protein [Peptococcaceae bacterium]|nr:nitroreductase family protein [Peptococcaceae bacterium]